MGRIYRVMRKTHGLTIIPLFIALAFFWLRTLVWMGMVLDHLGHRDAHDHIMRAIERVLAAGLALTPDMGGNASMRQLTDAVMAALE